MGALPRRQREIAEFIQKYILEERVPPTYREIADHFQVQISTIQEQLDALEKKVPSNGSKGARGEFA